MDGRKTTILDLPIELWELHVLPLLELRDLRSLTLACKTSRRAVQEFVRHRCASRDANRLAMSFLEDGLHTAEERAVAERVKALSSSAREFDRSLPFYEFVSAFGRPRKRLEVAKSSPRNFPHLGTLWVPVRLDRDLQRDVAVLEQVCWQWFQAEFGGAPPGRYRINARVRISDDVYFPGGPPTLLKTCRYGIKNGTLQEVSFRTGVWNELLGMPADQRRNVDGAAVTRQLNGWFLIEMPRFDLLEETPVKLIWEDIRNPGWKSGLSWDFVELEQVVS